MERGWMSESHTSYMKGGRVYLTYPQWVASDKGCLYASNQEAKISTETCFSLAQKA